MSLCLELPEVIEVDAGWSKPVPIVVYRGRATGPITVRFEGLPAGISLSPVAIPARLNRAQACVRAEIGACRAQARIRVTASAGNERAERPISLVVRANPSLAYRVKGHSLLAGGKPSEAVAAFSHALALASPDPIILNNRGLAYALLGQPDAAIADYTEALRLSPRDPVIRCNRGTAYARRGDSLRAQLDFDTAIRLNPGYIPAYRSRALLYARRGEPARAAADLVKADQLERAMSSASKPAAPVFSAVSSSSSEACYRAPTTLDRVGGS